MHNSDDDKRIANFFRIGHPNTFSKGELLVGSEPRPKGVYYIDTGYVQEYSITDKGEKLLHIIYRHGEIFPFIWAYLGVGTEVYYEALTDVLVWWVSREQYVLFAKESSTTSFALTAQLAKQHTLYINRIENLLLKHSKERVIHRLILLAERFGIHVDNEIRINLLITHEIIGDSINLSRESVSREMEKLEHAGLVCRRNHYIHILDLGELNRQLTTPINLDVLRPQLEI